MRRRDFMAAATAAVALTPFELRAQEFRRPIVGWLSSRSQQIDELVLRPFRRAMRGHGLVEHENFELLSRWAEGQYENLPRLAGELANLKVDVIALPGASAYSFQAMRSIGNSIPVVFITGSDPVRLGAVSSFNRPGGNMTGVAQLTRELASKRLSLLRELLPRASRIAVISNPTNPQVAVELAGARAAAPLLNFELDYFDVQRPADLETAFTLIADGRLDAIMVVTDPFLFTRSAQITALEARFKVPAIYFREEFIPFGGLISYGTDSIEASSLLGDYVGRILKGAKAGDLPVVQPTRFKLSINLRTARVLGIEIPTTLLTIADEVIE